MNWVRWLRWTLWSLALGLGLVGGLTGVVTWGTVLVWLGGLLVWRWLVYGLTYWALTRRRT